MVLPVPGLPVKTRWCDVSIVGRPRSAAQLLDAEEVGDQVHPGLDLLEPDQFVELGQQLLERAGRSEVGAPSAGRRSRRRSGVAGSAESGGAVGSIVVGRSRRRSPTQQPGPQRSDGSELGP